MTKILMVNYIMFAFLVFKRFDSCLSGPVRIDKHDFVPHPIVGTDSENPPPLKRTTTSKLMYFNYIPNLNLNSIHIYLCEISTAK